MVRGAQFGVDGGASGNGYLKLIVQVKHGVVYQIEDDRFARNVNVSLHDLADSFYPQWEAVFESGQAAGSMCAYPSVNSVPCCADSFLLSHLMRETWGMGDAFHGGSAVQGDCGAIENIASAHHYAKNNTWGAAAALSAGVDVDCGQGYTPNLQLAIEMGITTEATLDASLARTYTLQMLAGRFDPIGLQPYMSIPFEAIDSPAHRALAFESGLQGMVLLRNDRALLPLSPSASLRIAVVGPLGNSSDLAGNYYEQRCADNTLGCIPTLLDSIQRLAPSVYLSYAQGCPVTGSNTSGIPAAVTAAAGADVVILAIGTNSDVAEEGVDRKDIGLPGVQAQLVQAILATGKDVIVLLFNGGSLGVDEVVYNTNGTRRIALVESFFPGQAGGSPIAAQIFGLHNRWGKLPVTLYPLNWTSTMPIDEMSMTRAPGRTYKYYTGPVLYNFTFGLSYTEFSLAGSCPQSMGWSLDGASPLAEATDARGRGMFAHAAPQFECSITVTNVGAVDGDEVVFLFVAGDSNSLEAEAAREGTASPDPLAIRRLVGFQRLSVAAGDAVTVPFNVSLPMLADVSADGDRVVWPGQYTLSFTRGHGAVLEQSARVMMEHSMRPKEPGASSRAAHRIMVRQYPKRSGGASS